MKKIWFCLAFFILGSALNAQDNLSALLPMPNQVKMLRSMPFSCAVGETSYRIAGENLDFAKQTLCKVFQQQMDICLKEASAGEEASVVLQIDESITDKERYLLSVEPNGIVIKGATPGAVLYGVVTLEQLMMGDICTTRSKQIVAVSIDDAPRFHHRALMLDPARHFLPLDDVKFFIDQMMKFKYNVLQLHLTDDEGWRIAIHKQPQLASKDHYTQNQLKELIAYAAQRNIEIIPEIDVPGHTVAILDAYHELACSNQRDEDIKVGKSTGKMLCASNPKVYKIMQDVIDEVCNLFPSSLIHLGGDEAAVAKNWAKCEECQALMKKKGYTQPEQLMIPFFDRILRMVRANHKRPILWCELNNIYPPADNYLFPYPEDVVLVAWRAGLTPTCQKLTSQHGHALIMAPGEYAYYDYPQYKNDLPELLNWGMPTTTLRKVYDFDPGYGRPMAEQKHIWGVMGTLWGEAIIDINRATYMAFPRALALAEAGWTDMENRSWESFRERLYPNLNALMKQGVSVRVPFEISPYRK